MIRKLSFATFGFLAGVFLTAFVLHIQDDHVALIQHHEMQRTAHLTYDAELLTGLQTDPMINVSNGDITMRSHEQILTRLKAYFGSVEFDAWEDVQSPIIRVSDDGTLAAMIVKKHVALHAKDDQEKKSEVTFAWISLFEKVDGEWKIFAVASTRDSE